MKEERRQQQNLDRDVDRLFQEGFQEKARRLEAEAAREGIGMPDGRAEELLQAMLGSIRAGELGEEARRKLDEPADGTGISGKGVVADGAEDTQELLRLGRALKESGRSLEELLAAMPPAGQEPSLGAGAVSSGEISNAEEPGRDGKRKNGRGTHGRRRFFRTRRARVFAGTAAALVVVCAVTMSTQANRMYWVELLETLFVRGMGTVADEETYTEEGWGSGEGEALGEIKEKLGLEPLYFNEKPQGIAYEDAEVDDETGIGRVFYTYNDLIITVKMWRTSQRMTITVYYDGEVLESFQKELYDGTQVTVQKIQRDAEHTAYTVDFDRNGAFYSIMGDVSEDILDELIENVRFW